MILTNIYRVIPFQQTSKNNFEFFYKLMKNAAYGKLLDDIFKRMNLTCSNKTDDLYADMFNNKRTFDTSNYDKDNPLYDPINAKVHGKIKDDTAGNPVQEFIIFDQTYILWFMIHRKQVG